MLEDHLEKLRAFHQTATERSFLKASQKLGLTQPAVTKTVKLLEEYMKTTLFVRHPRGVTLTRQGTLLNKFCESLFLRVRDLEHQIHNSDPLSGIVRIGTYETLGELFWPRALKNLSQKFPALVIELTTENPESHFSRLETGGLDIIVDAEPQILERFYSRVLYVDSFGVFCKKNSPLLTAEGPIPISYVRRAIDRTKWTIESHLTRLEHKFDLRYSVESFTMVRALVSEGVCAGVLPIKLAEKSLRNGSIVPYFSTGKFENFGDHRICATCAQEQRQDPRISKIIDALKSAATQDA